MSPNSSTILGSSSLKLGSSTMGKGKGGMRWKWPKAAAAILRKLLLWAKKPAAVAGDAEVVEEVYKYSSKATTGRAFRPEAEMVAAAKHFSSAHKIRFGG
ncbi:unnamed protein product [Linum trigynum]|uniref:Uncharacterized protein n=1 Tax=Linum trigynum TaxID=586398 RepID=A0AAV2GCY3_9ROSI